MGISRGCWVIAATGGSLFSLSLVVHARELLVSGNVIGPAIAFTLDGGLSVVLVLLGVWLTNRMLSAADHWLVAIRTLAGCLSGATLIGLTLAVLWIEGRPLVEPVFQLLVGASGGGVLLFAVGYLSASKRRVARRYESVFDNTYQFTGIVQPDGTVVEVNETILSLTNRDEADLAGMKVWDTPLFARQSAAVRDSVKEAVEQARNGQPYYNQIRIQAVNGEREIDFSMRAVEDETGDVSFLIAEARDITQIQQSKEHSKVLHRYLRHNLRNELNIVHGYADLLSVRLGDPDRIAEAEKIRERTEEMMTTLDVVRRVSNLIRTDDQTLEATPVAELLTSIDARPTEQRVTVHPEFATVLNGLVASLAEYGDRDAISVGATPADDSYEITLHCDFDVPATELSEFQQSGEMSATHHPDKLSFWLTKALVRDAGGHIEFTREDDTTTIRLLLQDAAASQAT